MHICHRSIKKTDNFFITTLHFEQNLSIKIWLDQNEFNIFCHFCLDIEQMYTHLKKGRKILQMDILK